MGWLDFLAEFLPSAIARCILKPGQQLVQWHFSGAQEHGDPMKKDKK
jgi:hypothetical protein